MWSSFDVQEIAPGSFNEFACIKHASMQHAHALLYVALPRERTHCGGLHPETLALCGAHRQASESSRQTHPSSSDPSLFKQRLRGKEKRPHPRVRAVGKGPIMNGCRWCQSRPPIARGSLRVVGRRGWRWDAANATTSDWCRLSGTWFEGSNSTSRIFCARW